MVGDRIGSSSGCFWVRESLASWSWLHHHWLLHLHHWRLHHHGLLHHSWHLHLWWLHHTRHAAHHRLLRSHAHHWLLLHTSHHRLLHHGHTHWLLLPVHRVLHTWHSSHHLRLLLLLHAEAHVWLSTSLLLLILLSISIIGWVLLLGHLHSHWLLHLWLSHNWHTLGDLTSHWVCLGSNQLSRLTIGVVLFHLFRFGGCHVDVSHLERTWGLGTTFFFSYAFIPGVMVV